MPGGTSDRPRILVVDDDARNRELFRAWLEPAHGVLEAPDGASAVEQVRADRVDLVLLDVRMPGMSGIEACRAIRAVQPGDAFLPVVLVTALNDQATRNAGLEAGADDFVASPFDRTELALRISGFLRMRRQDVQIRAQLAEVTRLSALKEDLIALVAHDLRGPLGTILTLVALAHDEVEDPEVKKDLEVVRSAAERAREIAEDLLQVRLLEHGEHAPTRTATPVEVLVRDAVHLQARAALDRKVELRVSIDGDVQFPLDAPLVRRALENLVANAVKHSPAGAAVDVSVRRAGDALELDVVDRGPEVPAEARDAVFRTFASAARHAGARRAYGLGLLLVRLVGETHGGTASVLGAPGGGTTFRLRLEAPPGGNG